MNVKEVGIMSIFEYNDALKMGKKEYRSATVAGESPYLPVLDDILSHVEIAKEVPLGLVQIPLDRVVGTSTAGRTTAFARNFMPLLEAGSEFGTKWSNLCDSQIAEGIRDPIIAYEYMNRYYVVEGNKRVSVLKFFGAVNIWAQVTRKVPKPTEDVENKIYYEFLDFYQVTEINYLWAHRIGTFAKLLELTGSSLETKWTEEQKQDFTSFHIRFQSAYEMKGGKKLPITVADAMTAFITIYGYQEALEMTQGQMRANIEKVWNEFVMLTQEESVDLVMNPKQEKNKKSIFNYILPGKDKKLKVAFVYDKAPEVSDWIYAHELGRLYLEDQFKEQIETMQVIDTSNGANTANLLEEIIAEGANVIFTVTPKLMQDTLKVAINNQHVKLLNCSLNTAHRYIRMYYGRMYEAKFLTGMIAGAMADNDKIGYIAEYPIYGTIANINAFALGAKFVNPRAKIYLEWSTVEHADATTTFAKEGIQYLSGQDCITPQSASREFGLYYRGEHGPVNMAMPIWHWGVFYERLLQSIFSGSWQRDGQESAKSYNYWWGVSAGVIDVICSNNVPVEIRRLVDLIKESISLNHFAPFENEIYDQEGVLRNRAGCRMKPEEIMTMDWLLDNIIGIIPTIEELKLEARPVVQLSGVSSTEEQE